MENEYNKYAFCLYLAGEIDENYARLLGGISDDYKNFDIKIGQSISTNTEIIENGLHK